ncbi:MAG: hypothetical protein IPK80_06670 [Nannocystis sp.]|nr:hypothetical protein [Nannocystis sp.]
MLSTLVWLTLQAQAPQATEPLETAPICDDGAPAFIDSAPNWSCRRDGCAPNAAICWSDRLAHCYDDAGDETGRCELRDSTCEGVISCFNQWVWCKGVHTCEVGGKYTCDKGTCREASGVSSSSVATRTKGQVI